MPLNDLTAKQWVQRTISWFQSEYKDQYGTIPDIPPEMFHVWVKMYHEYLTSKDAVDSMGAADKLTWFVLHYKARSKEVNVHPAKFPEELPARFIEFFTKKGDWVLDPFAGVGSTLLAAKYLRDEHKNIVSRNAIGIELNPRYAKVAKSRLSQQGLEDLGVQRIFNGNAFDIDTLLASIHPTPKFTLVVTSPPYWTMLHKSRGGSDSSQKKRKENGLDTTFTTDPNDLGNMETYDQFLDAMERLFVLIKPHLLPNAYLVLIMQNFLDEHNEYIPMAWDVAYRLRKHYHLCQEQIWCQKDKFAGIWGFPSRYITNTHHHYAIVLQNLV